MCNSRRRSRISLPAPLFLIACVVALGALPACASGVIEASAIDPCADALTELTLHGDWTFRLIGHDWPPGQLVFVYLADPAAPDDALPIFSIQADARGCVDAPVPYPNDLRWRSLATVNVIVQDTRATDTRVRALQVAPASTASNALAAQPVATGTASPTLIPARTSTPTPLVLDRAFDQWTGEYFDNVDLAGLPSRVVNDGDARGIAYLDWGRGTPVPGIPADNFSVRWTRTFDVDHRETYRFSVRVDDGARVYVDNAVILDRWSGGPVRAPYSQAVMLSAGRHELRVEMVEYTGDALIDFRFGPLEECDGWWVEYFANRDLEGDSTSRCAGPILRLDRSGDAHPEGVPAGDFSARWTRTLNFPRDGEYRFMAQTNGGVRLSVDGMTLIGAWRASETTTHTASVRLSAGPHDVVLEYFAVDDEAHVAFVHYPIEEDMQGWKAEYFDHLEFEGVPLYVDDEGDATGFDLNWGLDFPHPGLPRDDFAVRLTRTICIEASEAGTYRFSLTADDGVRLYLDGAQVLDEWHRYDGLTHSVLAELDGRCHEVRVEHYEERGKARIRLHWDKVALTLTP